MKHTFSIILILFFCCLNQVIAQNVALNFDGSDDYIQTSHAGISGQNARTVEAMIRTTANCDPNQKGKQKVIVDWGTASTGARFTLNILWGNALRLEVSGSGLSGQTVINDGKWHHVAAVFTQVGKSNEIRLYVDGVLDTSGSIPTGVNTGSSVNVRIGQRIDNTNNFEGDIDEVRIFNLARSASDIKADIHKEYCKYPKGLVGYWKLNEGAANSSNSSNKTAKDYTSSKKDGTLTNFGLSGKSSNWITGDTLKGGDTRVTSDAFGCYSYKAADGTVYTSPGKYETVLTNAAGCDSIITLNLTLGRVYSFSRHTVCDSFVTPLGNTYYQTGFYRDTLVGVTPKGCDSVLIMEVVVNQPINTSEKVTECDSAEIEKKWYYKNAKISIDGKAVTGCDSTHTVDLLINPSNSYTIKEETCDRYTSSLGNVYTKSGLYKEKFSKANQYSCDSVIFLDLTINHSITQNIPTESCDSFVSPGGFAYYKDGLFTESYSTSKGCDSILKYNVDIHNATSSSENVDACDSAQVDGMWYTVSKIIELNKQTINGCDSNVTVDLTVTTVDNKVTQTGKTLTAQQIDATYQWVDCKTNKNINGETSKEFTAPYSGDFAVDVTVNKCTKRSECVALVGLNVSDFHPNDLFTVSPNPFNKSLTLSTNSNESIAKVVITDIQGKIVYQRVSVALNSVDVVLNVAPGFYQLTLTTSSGKTAVQRIVAQ